jgi:hypothetical protein
MGEWVKARYLWFRCAIVIGLLLGLLLLIDTVITYRYVARGLVGEEVHEAPKQIAWIRILTMAGRVAVGAVVQGIVRGDSQQQEIGAERLLAAIKRNRAKSPADICHAILADGESPVRKKCSRTIRPCWSLASSRNR